MRGWPLVELLGITLALLLALIPLVSFTRSGSAALVETQGVSLVPAESQLVEVYLVCRFAHPPSSFRVSQDGRVLWQEQNPEPASEYVGDAKIDLPEEGAELQVEVKWPEGTPHTVVELWLEPDAWEGKGVTMWGRETLNEIVSYRWCCQLPNSL